MGLHLNPCELNTAVNLWLGLNPHSENNAIPHTCPLCPESMLDPLCHHSVTCKRGGDVTNRHNLLRNAIYEACHQASLSVRLEVGGGLGRDKALTRPADILVSNPSGSASAAYDITVTSPLNPSIILEAGVSAGTAAKAAEIVRQTNSGVVMDNASLQVHSAMAILNVPMEVTKFVAVS
ncbi:hypothetical protein EMCRGX_G001894 [Ephydatia muelleri]